MEISRYTVLYSFF